MESENNAFEKEIACVEDIKAPVPQMQKIESIPMPRVAEAQNYEELAKDFANVEAVKRAVQDGELMESLTERKKDELKESADSKLKREKVKSADAEKELQQSQFGVYEGVASLAGVKRSLPQTMQKVLFGILSVFQTIILIIMGVPVSIVNIICDCIDAVCKKLSSVVKSARYTLVAIVIAGLLYLFVLLVLWALRKYGIITEI